MSRIGKKPIPIPKGVSVTVGEQAVEVKVGGALAALGGRLMEAAAHKNIADTFSNLAREMSKGEGRSKK